MEHIQKSLKSLSVSLEPIIPIWSDTLNDATKHISSCKEPSDRLAAKIAFRKYRNNLVMMQDLQKDIKYQIENNSIDILYLLQKINLEQKANEEENVGDNIVDFINDIDRYIDNRISKAIQFVEYGNKNKILSNEEQRKAIKLLNVYIVFRNRQICDPKSTRGIIIQLKEPGCVSCDHARMYNIQCETCNHVEHCSGAAGSSIFAPPYCSQCSSAKLREVPHNVMKQSSVVEMKKSKKWWKRVFRL